MKEPSVIIQMIADVIPSNATAGQNIAAGVIIAECGTLKPKVFYSSTEVLKEFTKSGQLTRKSDITLIHAAAIADIMPVLLKRSYYDDGTRAGFGVLKTPTDSGDVYHCDVKSLPSAEVGVVYDLTGTKNDDSGNILEVGTLKLDGTNLASSESGTTATLFELKPNKKYNKIVVKTADTSKFSYAFVTDSLGQETYITFDKITKSNDQILIECGNRSESDSITTVFSSDTLVTDIDYQFADKKTYVSLYFKNETPLLYKQEMDFGEGPVSIDPIDFKILAAGYLFYNGTQTAPVAPTGYKLFALDNVDRKSTNREIIDSINKQLKTSYIDYDGSSFTLYSETLQPEFDGDYSNDLGTSESVLSSDEEFCLYLYSNYPSSIEFTAKINPNNDDKELIDVTVVTAARSYEYVGSLDPDYVNSYGANQFIENIDEYDGIPFTIKVVDKEFKASEVPTTPTVAFGMMNIGTGADIATRRAGLEELIDQDDIKIAFLCPFGYNNNSYLAKLASYTTKIWAFNPVGLYCYKNDPEAIIASRPSISNEYTLLMAPHDKSTLMTDWVVDMTLEVSYLQRIMGNAAKGCEFAPMMGKENSPLQLTKPSVTLTKSTREKLLDARIMSIITRDNGSLNYLNKNQCSGGDTILSEEQNARLACKINRDLDVLLEPIIGRYNTEETRSRVVTTINNYFTQNITNQVFSIDGYEVVCDESNNPPNIRANNQLVIDLNVTYLNAIYDVLIYHRALNVASNNE